MAGEGSLLAAGGQIPHAHRAVVASADRAGAVLADRDRTHPIGVAGEGGVLAAGGQVPHAHRPVVASADRAGAVLADRDRADRAGVTGEDLLEQVDRSDSRADHRRQPVSRRAVSATGKASGPGCDTGIWMTQQAVGEMRPDERRVGGQRRGRYPQGPHDLASERIAGIPVVTNKLMCRPVGEAGLDPLGVGKNSAQFAAEMCVVQVTG